MFVIQTRCHQDKLIQALDSSFHGFRINRCSRIVTRLNLRICSFSSTPKNTFSLFFHTRLNIKRQRAIIICSLPIVQRILKHEAYISVSITEEKIFHFYILFLDSFCVYEAVYTTQAKQESIDVLRMRIVCFFFFPPFLALFLPFVF